MADLRPAPPDVERFRDFVTRWLGFELNDEKLWSLSDLLRSRIQKRNCGAEAYLSSLENAHPFSDELRSLAHELTINETSFFRHADQMAAFSDVAVPECLAGHAHRLRILSAGCASGEEAYSLAMIIRNLPQAAELDIAITGIDADTQVLGKAAAARYSAWSLRQTPASYRSEFFRPDRREFVLADSVRRMVMFEERNLVVDDPVFWAPDSFDIVFCRNVIMYFTPDVARAVVARIAASLAPGGFLFLGHAETMRGLSDEFELRHTHGTFYYRRRGGAARRSPPQEAAPMMPGADFVEAIGGASRRIRSLTAVKADGRKAAKPSGPDLAPAIELFRCEKVDEAMALLAQLPQRHAHDPQVLLLTAIFLTHGGDLVRAESVCAELLSRDGMNAGGHYLMALCRESAGDPAGTAEHDRWAIRLDPDFAMPHLHLGVLARRSGDPAAARRALTMAAALIRSEDTSRLLLFGGGFGREALSGLCQAQLNACGDHHGR